MLERFFKYQSVLNRHKNAPFLEERERYLTHKEKEGYAQTTLERMARELFWVAQRFQGIGSNTRKIKPEEIQEVANNWAQEQYCSDRAKGLKWSRELFIHTSTDWFRFLGCLREHRTIVEPVWYERMTLDFATFMENEQGLSQKTIDKNCWYTRKFLHWFNPDGGTISAICVSDFDRFLKEYGGERWSRVTVSTCVDALRSFFRYASIRNWCSSQVAQSIQGPRLFAQESLPVGPSWEEVIRLIESMDTNRACDIRDRAIVMLFAIYGLRSSEVLNIRLEDLNWEYNQIEVIRKKQRRSEVYPLIPIVGNALIQYLQSVRPRCSQRKVFLTLRAPVKPIAAGTLYLIVRKRIEKLGIQSMRQGPHALRHACATRLVSEGFSLKEIGDHLGHRSTDATRIYAKVDLPHLREVAAFNFGGLL